MRTGEAPPFVRSGLAPLVDRVLEELGVQRYATECSAAIGLACIRLRKMLDGQVSRDAVISEVAGFYGEMDHDRVFLDFCLLDAALDEIRSGDVQICWPEGGRERCPR